MASPQDIRQLGKEAVSDLEERRSALHKELQQIEKHLDAWSTILAPYSDGGSADGEHLANEDAQQLDPTSTRRNKADRQSLTVVAKRLMNEAGTAGFEPRDITQGLLREGFDVHLTAGSNVIHRLKARGEVRSLHGRYYLTEYARDIGYDYAGEEAQTYLDQQQTPP